MLYHIMPLERDSISNVGESGTLHVGTPRLVQLDRRFRSRDEAMYSPVDLHVHVGLDFAPVYDSKVCRPEMYKALGWYMSDYTDRGERVFYETLFVRVNNIFIPIRLETFSGSRFDDHKVINLNNLAALHQACGASVTPDLLIDPKRSIIEGDHEVCRQLRIPQEYVDIVGEAYRRSPYLKGIAYDYLSPDLAAQELSILARVCSSRNYTTPVIDRTIISSVAPIGLDPAVAVQFANQGGCKNPYASDLTGGRVPIDISQPTPIPLSTLDNVVMALPQHMMALSDLRDLTTDFKITIATRFTGTGDDAVAIDIIDYVDRYGYVLNRRFTLERLDSIVKSTVWGLRHMWSYQVMATRPIPADVVVDITITKTFGDEMLVQFDTRGVYPELNLNVYVDFALRAFVSFGAAYG